MKTNKKQIPTEMIQFNFCPVMGFYVTYIPVIPIDLRKKLIK